MIPRSPSFRSGRQTCAHSEHEGHTGTGCRGHRLGSAYDERRVGMSELHLPPQLRGTEQLAVGLDDSVYNRLLKERIIFLGSEVNTQVANRICAQLLLLSAEDPERDITLYINSPGGSVYSG